MCYLGCTVLNKTDFRVELWAADNTSGPLLLLLLLSEISILISEISTTILLSVKYCDHY